MNRTNTHNDSGFTLTELMMAIFIMSMLTFGVYGVFISSLKLWHSTSLDIRTANTGSMALERFVYGEGRVPGLRAAYEHTVSLSKNGEDWTLYYNTPDTTNNYLQYDYDARTLSFSAEGNSAHIITRNVSYAFVSLDPSGARLTLEMEVIEGRHYSIYEFSTYVVYRN